MAPVLAAAGARLAGIQAALERGTTYSGELLAARADLSTAAMAATRALCPTLAPDRAAVPAAALAHEIARQACEDAGTELGASDLTRDTLVFDDLWTRHQRPTFVLTASLTATLLLTDPGRVQQSDVAWPFPAFRIVLPHPEPRISFTGVDGAQEVVARSIDVVSWDLLGTNRNDQTSVPLPRFSREDTLRSEIETFLLSVQPLLNSPSTPGVCARVHGEGFLSVYANWPWRGDQTVEAWLTARDAVGPPSNGPLSDNLTANDADARALAICQRLACNLALYLSSVRETDGAPVWTAASKTTGKGRRWEVGREVRIGPEVRRAATEVAAGRTAKAPAVRHIVRGHFRNQACGAGRLERRRLYVAPHWRCPDSDATTSRTYKVI
jgi:hypothetical protein